MLRRVLVPAVQVGELDVPSSEAHHLRTVLRLKLDDELELFDDRGRTARGRISRIAPHRLTVLVESVIDPLPTPSLTVASALPKGDRADWVVEKLCELGVHRFVPLQTQRSVVHPEGKSKFERWNRIAGEAAKQSRRAGVMQIDPLTPLTTFLAASASPRRLYLSPGATSSLLAQLDARSDLALLIGPEGGWTDDELQLFESYHVQPASLTDSILRIETAAITAAAIVQCAFPNRKSHI